MCIAKSQSFASNGRAIVTGGVTACQALCSLCRQYVWGLWVCVCVGGWVSVPMAAGFHLPVPWATLLPASTTWHSITWLHVMQYHHSLVSAHTSVTRTTEASLPTSSLPYLFTESNHWVVVKAFPRDTFTVHLDCLIHNAVLTNA